MIFKIWKLNLVQQKDKPKFDKIIMCKSPDPEGIVEIKEVECSQSSADQNN